MKCWIFFLSCFMALHVVYAQPTQWRGPDRNGLFPAENLLPKWPDEGPEMILKVENIGSGFSSPIYYNNSIYISGKVDSLDYLTRVDMAGNIIFQVQYGKAWEASYPDSRSTPTIENERVYLISGMGEVVCIDANDGALLWMVNAHEKYEGALHRWGVAESPLIVENKVIYTTGGEKTSVVALDKKTGEEVWTAKSLGGPKAFVSPILYEYNGVRLIVAATAEDVLGIDPDNGDILWSHENFPENDDDARSRATIKTNSAIYTADELFISRGYDQVSFMLKIAPDGKSVQEKWTEYVMDTHHGGYVHVGDYLFGSNWESNSKGKWVCLEWSTGKVMYEEQWITKGSIVYADGMLYCYEERSGTVALVNPNPERFERVSEFRIKLGSGPHWAHPYIADGKLFVRHGDVLMVFDISAQGG